MIHSMYNSELGTKISIDETLCENTCIAIKDDSTKESQSHYLTPKELSDFIGMLLYVQSKKKKGGNNGNR